MAEHAAKDAMFLLELMRDSPQPFLLHVAPYAEKTGTKIGTLQKRLSTIRDRQGLNIITTASPVQNTGVKATRNPPTARPRSGRDDEDDGKPKIKREKATKQSKKSTAPTGNHARPVKAEEDALPESGRANGLPSPAKSSPETPLSKWTKGKPTTALSTTDKANINTEATQMPLSMPQKRPREDTDGDQNAKDESSVLKKVKTETWSFA